MQFVSGPFNQYYRFKYNSFVNPKSLVLQAKTGKNWHRRETAQDSRFNPLHFFGAAAKNPVAPALPLW